MFPLCSNCFSAYGKQLMSAQYCSCVMNLEENRFRSNHLISSAIKTDKSLDSIFEKKYNSREFHSFPE